MFSLFDVIIAWFNGIKKKPKYLGHDVQWAITEIIAFPRIITPFDAKNEIVSPGYYSRKYGMAFPSYLFTENALRKT